MPFNGTKTLPSLLSIKGVFIFPQQNKNEDSLDCWPQVILIKTFKSEMPFFKIPFLFYISTDKVANEIIKAGNGQLSGELS